MSRLLAAISNLIVPGTGLVQLGRWRWACSIQVALLTLTLILCWSRWVFEPVAIQGFLALVAVIYFFSTGLCLSTLLPSPAKPVRLIALSSVFMFASLVGLAAGFVFKQHWLGIHVYFVPSMSMHPTLKPGQFILLDTWAYRNKAPLLNDVIVFEHGIKQQHLVKRINTWPNGKLTKDKSWYVMGDNRRASQDSRYFGGIKTEQLIGEVKLIIIAFDKKKPLKIDLLLTPVH